MFKVKYLRKDGTTIRNTFINKLQAQEYILGICKARGLDNEICMSAAMSGYLYSEDKDGEFYEIQMSEM